MRDFLRDLFARHKIAEHEIHDRSLQDVPLKHGVEVMTEQSPVFMQHEREAEITMLRFAGARINRPLKELLLSRKAFGDDYYKMPTPAEIHTEFAHWRATKMMGYLIYAWHWPRNNPALWLANAPEVQQQLAIENSR